MKINISFIEKEPFNTRFITGEIHRLVPVFMVKDNAEYFMVNRRIDCGDKNDTDIESYKEMLLSNGGKFFRFYGCFEDPFEMLSDMKKHTYHFVEPEKVIERFDGNGYGKGFYDFGGNFKEVSAAFNYRIFCTGYAEKLNNLVAAIMGQ